MTFYVWISYIVWMLLVNAATALMYVIDKHAAQSKTASAADRVPEVRLLTFSMLGGWPAAIAVGRKIRHKTQKLSYRVWFALAVTTNVGIHAIVLYIYFQFA